MDKTKKLIASFIFMSVVLLMAPSGTAQVNGAGLSETEKLIQLSRRPTSTMDNPYELIENWPTLLAGQEWGAAIGLIPDDTGGLWMLFRSEPPINYINADGQILKSFGDGMIVQAHGFCMDNDGNLWAGDSGPFGDDPTTAGRGFQIHKFSQEGEHLLSLGQAGLSRAAEDTFIGPTVRLVFPVQLKTPSLGLLLVQSCLMETLSLPMVTGHVLPMRSRMAIVW